LGQKAEGAFIVTGTKAIKKRFNKFNTEILVGIFLYCISAFFALLANKQLNVFFGGCKAIVDHIAQAQITHRDHGIAGLQSKFFSYGTGKNLANRTTVTGDIL